MFRFKIKKPKVFVMMSGGVDSAVAALLLKKRNYNPIGVYMINWHGSREESKELCCPWENDIEDARLVCSLLNIPFYVVDFSKEYQKKVVEYMVNAYQSGFTPNPDVMCNKEIKFGIFFDWAEKQGADYVATGHYARKKIKKTKTGKIIYELHAGLDKQKDQSYFLWTLKQKILAKALFPVGNLTKIQVRKIAAKSNLPVADKKDSQGICFIGKIKLSSFLGQYIKPKPGLVVDTHGAILGKHKGIYYYTIGQRHGLGIGGGTPLYVAEKKLSENLLVVAKGRSDPLLYKKKIYASQINWINSKPKFPLICYGRIRYQQPLSLCKIQEVDDFALKVVFKDPQFAVASGQSVVFYQNTKVIGGAVVYKA